MPLEMQSDPGRPIESSNEAPLTDAQMTAFADGRTPDYQPVDRFPMETPTQAKAPAEPVTPPVTQQKPQSIQDFEDEIQWNGKAVKLPYSKIKNFAQMAYNHSEVGRELKQRTATLDARDAETKRLVDYYKPIDDYAKANPDWFEHVKRSFETRGQNPVEHVGDPSTPQSPELRAALGEIAGLKQQLQEMGSTFKEFTEWKTQQKVQSEDAQLQEQLDAVQKEFPDQDWATPDDQGHVLADRIIVHAHKNGIKNVRAAARDLLFEDVVKRSELKGQEHLANTLKTTRLPNGQFAPRQNVVTRPGQLRPPSSLNASYDDLIKEGMAELGN